jgi:membrane-bound inhibitor of C-type lysozyme
MRALVLILALSLAACTRTDTAPAPETAPVQYATYRCDSGRTVEAAYPATGEAIVRYEGRELDMASVEAASGARYAGGGYVWWTRGTGPGAEGSLYREAQGEAGEPVETCRQEGETR